MTTLLSRYITRRRGASFSIDERITSTYLFVVVAERIVMTIRGMARFPLRGARPFIGSGVRLRSRGSITFGPGVTLGSGVRIEALSTDGVRLGANTSVGRNTRIECTGSIRNLGVGIDVGRDVGLGTDCFYGCAGGIRIGNDTIIGNFVSFHSENHISSQDDVPIRLQGVTHVGISVGANCWIGAKATILDGVTLGEGSVVAAGSVLTAGSYAADGIYGGVPARLLRSRR